MKDGPELRDEMSRRDDIKQTSETSKVRSRTPETKVLSCNDGKVTKVAIHLRNKTLWIAFHRK